MFQSFNDMFVYIVPNRTT